MDGIYAAIAGAFGLFIGSFLNVLIYRLPRGEDFVRGRSHCPRCGHDLAAFDLFPVFSYLLLGRRCRYCKAPISSRYAIVELLTGVGFAVAWLLIGSFSVAVFLCLSLLISLAIVAMFIRIDRNRVPRGLKVAVALVVVLLALVLFIRLG